MECTSQNFKTLAQEGINNPVLRSSLSSAQSKFVDQRALARAALPEFELLREEARLIKKETLRHLDSYLERFEAAVGAKGGKLHFAADAKEASAIAVRLAQKYKAKKLVKSKSMLSEEVGVNAAFAQAGIKSLETDLGEYIIQLRQEPPSHIIAPALHLRKAQITETFRRFHSSRDPQRSLDKIEDMQSEARQELRQHFLSADMGLVGANMLVAESGSVVVVTNEGNADLCQSLPAHLLVMAGPEKLVPGFEQAATLLRLLARSATGQETSVYTSLITGAKRQDESDGPETLDIILVDNGRLELLGSSFETMLSCIRCGACLNHCPVYQSIGGHAYGWAYSGPMGAVITPAYKGIKQAVDLPFASSLCGRCGEVCPVKIPLPELLRNWREKAFGQKLTSFKERLLLFFWKKLAQSPRLYTASMAWVLPGLKLGSWFLHKLGLGKRRWPVAQSWRSFQQQVKPK